MTFDDLSVWTGRAGMIHSGATLIRQRETKPEASTCEEETVPFFGTGEIICIADFRHSMTPEADGGRMSAMEKQWANGKGVHLNWPFRFAVWTINLAERPLDWMVRPR